MKRPAFLSAGPEGIATAGDALKYRIFRYTVAVPVVILAVVPIFVLVLLAADTPFSFGSRNGQILANTVALTGLTVAGTLLLGVPLAFVTTCLSFRGSGFAFMSLVAPLAVPSYLGGFVYFAASGVGGEFAEIFGLALPEVRGLAGTALVMVLYTLPFVVLTMRSSLRRLDASLFEAGRTMGLSPTGAFFRILLPRTRGGMAAGASLVALYTLSDFATPAILGLDTFTRAIYVEYNAFGLGRAALYSLQLLGLVVLVLALESRFRPARERSGRPLRWVPGPAVTTGVLAAVGAVWLAAVGAPVLLFLVWLTREGTGGFDPVTIWNSFLPASLAAVFAVLAAFPVALAASAGRAGRWMARMTSFGFGLPGIVMGTALVYVSLQLPWIYQTIAMLVLGYVLRFLPLASGALGEGIGRIEPHVILAARSLGASPAEAFRRVTFPLLLPAVLSGAAMVFLEAMRELPLTLLLRPSGTETLTTRLWQVYEAGYFGEAAIPGLLLILVSSFAMLFFLRSERLLGIAER